MSERERSVGSDSFLRQAFEDPQVRKLTGFCRLPWEAVGRTSGVQKGLKKGEN